MDKKKEKDKEITNQEIFDKLIDIDKRLQGQEDEQTKNSIVTIGFSLVVFGLSVLLVGMTFGLSFLTLQDIARSFVNIIFTGIIIVVSGFILINLSNKITKHFKNKKSK